MHNAIVAVSHIFTKCGIRLDLFILQAVKLTDITTAPNSGGDVIYTICSFACYVIKYTLKYKHCSYNIICMGADKPHLQPCAVYVMYEPCHVVSLSCPTNLRVKLLSHWCTKQQPHVDHYTTYYAMHTLSHLH